MECLPGLQWWLHLPRLSLGVSLHQVSPVLHFWSDASDVVWAPISTYQRRGTASCSAGAFPVPVPSPRSHSGCLLRRLHSCAFPAQGGWPLVSYLHHLGSGDLALDGVHLHPPASPVPSGLRHRPNRLPVSPSPAHTSRVVFTHDRLSVF